MAREIVLVFPENKGLMRRTTKAGEHSKVTALSWDEQKRILWLLSQPLYG